MKAKIIDIEALQTITPAALSAFARAEGWVKSEVYGEHADIYVGEGRPEIVLPRTSALADYASVVSRLIAVFSHVMDRDEIEAYRDLIDTDRDVLRIRATGSDDDGSIGLNDGVELVAHARDMLLAAACATKSNQPYYRAGANRDAIDYMDRVKLGQTEHGSFVVKLLAPVPPLMQPQLDPSWVPIEDEPLERMVTRRLMEALAASRRAVELVVSGDGNAFEKAICYGVSANLCEAVANMIGHSNGLDISLTWARTRPTPEPRRTVSFSPNDYDALKEAARTFRLRQPKENVTLLGFVHKLRRDLQETDGTITIKAIVDDKLHSVSVVLGEEYSKAVLAHDDKKPMLMNGDLRRIGQRWQLDNASVLELSSEDESESRLDN